MVVVDGEARIVDLYSPTRHWHVPIRIAGLTRGAHRLTVTPLGRKDSRSRSSSVVVDAFVVCR